MSTSKRAVIFLWLGLLAGLGAAQAAGPAAPAANAGWQEVGAGSASGGGISANESGSYAPALAVYPDGTPIVAWANTYGTSTEIYARHWNGLNWVELGDHSASTVGISLWDGWSGDPSLAVGAGGPIVAWSDDAEGNGEIYLRRWNGLTWAHMGGSAYGGGISNNAGNSFSPSLAILPDGTPIVAWADDSDGVTNIYVRRWNGTTWVEMGAGSAAGGGISQSDGAYGPSLAIGPAGTPYVAWNDDSSGNAEIYVRRWDGLNWVEVGPGSAGGGGISQSSGNSFSPALVVDDDGAPIVAWIEHVAGQWQLYIRRWDGAAWQEIGAGSASGGGVSGNGNYLWLDFSLAQTADGRPILAWSDETADEIFVKVWNNFAWVEMDVGSAAGGGISQTAGLSHDPALAVAPDGRVLVAWQDDTANNAEIYVRRSSPTADSCHSLTLTYSGDGEPPTADPTNSAGCAPGFYKAGRMILLTAEPGPEMQIIGWWGTDDDASTAATNTVTMPAADHSAGPSYAPYYIPCYSLSLSHTGQGADPTADPLAGHDCVSGTYTYQDWITLTAAPAAGWRVAGWSGTNDDSSKALVNLLTMPENDHAVTVIYERDPSDCYTLSRGHTGQGSHPTAAPANSAGCAAGKYAAGEAITLTAAPAVGWRVAGWNGAADAGSKALTNSLIMPAAPHTVSVAYEVVPAQTHRLLAPVILYRPAPPCWAGPDEIEPNNGKDTANGSLCSGTTYHGRPQDEYDVFFFDTVHAGPITIELTDFGGGGGQLVLLSAGFLPIEADQTPGNGFHIARADEPAGRYFVSVHAAVPNAAAGPYGLRVTFAGGE